MAYNGDNFSLSQTDGDATDEYSDAVLLQLNRLCAPALPPRNKSNEAKYQSEASWVPVREWMNAHSDEAIRQAALQRGDSNLTALHFACRNGAVIEIIDIFLTLAPETVQWQDSFGWLPIHYACACGATTEIIKKLAEAYPEGKTTVDRRGRTPLHFALGNQNLDQLAAAAVVAILSSTGAASVADENGMLVSFTCDCGK